MLLRTRDAFAAPTWDHWDSPSFRELAAVLWDYDGIRAFPTFACASVLAAVPVSTAIAVGVALFAVGASGVAGAAAASAATFFGGSLARSVGGRRPARACVLRRVEMYERAPAGPHAHVAVGRDDLRSALRALRRAKLVPDAVSSLPFPPAPGLTLRVLVRRAPVRPQGSLSTDVWSTLRAAGIRARVDGRDTFRQDG